MAGKSLIFSSILFGAIANIAMADSFPGTDVIYGIDNRKEINDYENEMIVKNSKSIAVKVSNQKLSIDESNPELINILNIPLKQAMPNLCESERFSEQPQLGDCSGFLISSNKILTAGHCAFSKYDCANFSWVFNFVEGRTTLNKDEVYKCKRIVTQKYEYSDKVVMDYAIIELDRDTNRDALKMRKFGKPFLGTQLVIVGHPLGLPMKAADMATVKLPNDQEMQDLFKTIKLRKNYFTANLDSYGGNSGSPVFNKKTGKVEGILIQGADDFKFNMEKECLESNNLSNSHKNTYEKVLRINKIDLNY